MTRLNQIVALELSVKQEAEKVREQARNKAALLPQMAGIARTYSPKDDDGDRLPPESTRVQISVAQILEELGPPVERLFDLVATKETANRSAVADVVVDGTTLARDVPVTVLLFLERQLAELRSVVQGLPVLDPAEMWIEDEPGIYKTPPRNTVRTVKLPKAFVRYEATKEHPAQVDTYTEDNVVGQWETVKFSGAMEARDKLAILDRIRKVTAAVLQAREQANSVEVTDVKLGEDVLGYLFG